jgi:hypothetical protein
LEHIVPTVEGGSDDIENRALACAACNFHPRSDACDEYFRWQNDPPTILARTPEGRATVVVLDLNSEWRLEARRLCYDAGLLP